jgi:hypothetical protein
LQQCVDYFFQVGEKNLQAQGLTLLEYIAEIENDLLSALEYGQKSRNLLKDIHQAQHLGWTLVLGRLYYQTGEVEVGRRYLRESLRSLWRPEFKAFWWRLDYIFGQMGALLVDPQTQLAVQFFGLAKTISNAPSRLLGRVQ